MVGNMQYVETLFNNIGSLDLKRAPKNGTLYELLASVR